MVRSGQWFVAIFHVHPRLRVLQEGNHFRIVSGVVLPGGNYSGEVIASACHGPRTNSVSELAGDDKLSTPNTPSISHHILDMYIHTYVYVQYTKKTTKNFHGRITRLVICFLFDIISSYIFKKGLIFFNKSVLIENNSIGLNE